MAMRHGIVHGVARGSKDYDSDAVCFRVHDRGNGRVALEAMNGTGFITVVGEGLSADVRLMEKETAGSLSMRTHRFVGCEPTTGEPYSADNAGTTPDRKNGTVFKVEIRN